MASIYLTGTVSVTNDDLVVTGSGTAWAVAGIGGGMFSSAGVSVPIASVESDTSLTLAYPWPGDDAAGAAYAIQRDNSDAASVVDLYDRFSRILVTLSLIGIHPNDSGTIAKRDALTLTTDDEGFFFAHVEIGYEITLYRWTGTAWEGPFDTRGMQGVPGVGSGGYGLPSGGTTGQFLLKASGTDGDAEWAAEVDDSSAAIADPSKFWNPTYFGGNPGDGIVHRFNRVLVGEAALGSSDSPQSTKDWLETLIGNTVVYAQLASVNAIGGLGVVGAARTSDYRTWKSAASGGAEGLVGIGWNDDTGAGTPIAVGADLRGLRKSGVNGITAGAQIAAANEGGTVDVTPHGGVASGSTFGLLITNGPGPVGYSNPISAHLAMASGSGSEVARKGFVLFNGALDTSLGAGGGGIAFEGYRGQSFRWLNAGDTVDAELWGDASGLNLNGALNVVRAGRPGYFKNTNDVATNVGLRLESARATRANNDAITIDWYIANSAGTATVAARFSASLSNVASGAEAGAFTINLTSGGVGLSKGFVWTPLYAAPSADDGAALGAAGTAWSDLFLASGAVINWNNGDVLLTHTANTLAYTGASSGYTFDALVQATQFNVGANKILGARDTGWSAMTGTADKATAFATSTVTLAQLAGRVMSLQAALTTHGIIGV